MPLGRTQTQIIDKLEEMGKLTADQKTVLLARPDEPTGDQLDQILQTDHHITMFQLLLAKCRALGLATPSGPKTVFNLDVTFSGCTYPGYNQRYSGNLFLYPKDSYVSLRLRSYRVDTSSAAVSYDVRATLKR